MKDEKVIGGYTTEYKMLSLFLISKALIKTLVLNPGLKKEVLKIFLFFCIFLSINIMDNLGYFLHS
jgi:hypothetical protein